MLKESLMNNIPVIQYLLVCCVVLVSFILIAILKKQWLEKIYKHRYLTGFFVLIICVIFEISGSSIGMWGNYLGGNSQEGVLLGESRGIRSDEWVVNTPMAFSQKYNENGEYPYFSDTIRGDKTDTFIVYGQPVWTFGEVYRPFHLGYLLLGAAKGLSFFWCARLIFLFIVSFDFCMLLTKKNKFLSLIGAILIALAPVVSWWFAVNGLVEMILAGEVAILFLQKYMTSDSYSKRWLYLIGITLSAGTYLLTFYPSWQVPFIYVFAAVAIWVLIENWKSCKIKKKDVLAIMTMILLFGISMFFIFSRSLDTVKTVLNTAYPGARCELGGGSLKQFVTYPVNMLFGFKESGFITNVCEESVFFDLFPLGLVFSGIVFFKNKKKDKLIICLLTAFTFLALWCVVGFPQILAKITLLSNSQASRAFVAVGFINVLLLIRAMAEMKEPIKKIPAGIVAIGLAVLVTMINRSHYPNYMGNLITAFILIAMTIIYYLAMRYPTKMGRYIFAIVIAFTMLLSGAIVNPIRTGNQVIYGNDLTQKIQEIEKEENGLWIVENIGFPVINLPIMAGAPTVNCTNVYPNLDRWYLIDPNHEAEEIYNRYAHIRIQLQLEKTEFVLDAPDSFTVHLKVDDLKKLGVTYILTNQDLTKLQTEQIQYEKLYEQENYFIYQVKY